MQKKRGLRSKDKVEERKINRKLRRNWERKMARKGKQTWPLAQDLWKQQHKFQTNQDINSKQLYNKTIKIATFWVRKVSQNAFRNRTCEKYAKRSPTCPKIVSKELVFRGGEPLGIALGIVLEPSRTQK